MRLFLTENERRYINAALQYYVYHTVNTQQLAAVAVVLVTGSSSLCVCLPARPSTSSQLPPASLVMPGPSPRPSMLPFDKSLLNFTVKFEECYFRLSHSISVVIGTCLSKLWSPLLILSIIKINRSHFCHLSCPYSIPGINGTRVIH